MARLLYPDKVAFPPAKQRKTPAADQQARRFNLREADAFQNSVNVAMCNRVGVEGSMEFSGESLVAGFDGETIEMAGDQEELMLAEVNLSGATLKTSPTAIHISSKNGSV